MPDMQELELRQLRGQVAAQATKANTYLSICLYFLHQMKSGGGVNEVEGGVAIPWEDFEGVPKDWIMKAQPAMLRAEDADEDAEAEKMLVVQILPKPDNGQLVVPRSGIVTP